MPVFNNILPIMWPWQNTCCSLQEIQTQRTEKYTCCPRHYAGVIAFFLFLFAWKRQDGLHKTNHVSMMSCNRIYYHPVGLLSQEVTFACLLLCCQVLEWSNWQASSKRNESITKSLFIHKVHKQLSSGRKQMKPPSSNMGLILQFWSHIQPSIFYTAHPHWC